MQTNVYDPWVEAEDANKLYGTDCIGAPMPGNKCCDFGCGTFSFLLKWVQKELKFGRDHIF